MFERIPKVTSERKAVEIPRKISTVIPSLIYYLLQPNRRAGKIIKTCLRVQMWRDFAQANRGVGTYASLIVP